MTVFPFPSFIGLEGFCLEGSWEGIDAPICQDTGLGGLGLVLASSVVGHDALVDLAGEEALQASNDVTFGPAVRRCVGRRS